MWVRFLPVALIIAVVVSVGYRYINQGNTGSMVSNALFSQSQEKERMLNEQLSSVSAELTKLQQEDQVVKNKQLEDEIKSIRETYDKALKSYEDLVDYKDLSKKTKVPQDDLFAKTLKQLSERNYSTASATIAELDKQVKTESDKVNAAMAAAKSAAQAAGPTAAAPANNTPPGSGFSRQSVQTDSGSFTVDIIAADLNSTRVIVDTASDGDCRDNCPVLSLGDYVSRNGAFAGINGAYFCPASYPSCAGKTNSFDTLLMNKNKKYFNSDNNVYSTVPAVIFQGNSARFVRQSLEWGRDTGPDAVLANYPLLTLDGQNVYGGSGDGKLTSKGPRGFVGASGNTVYIGVVYSATVGEAAKVLQTMGIKSSMNLDSGGSTALWSGGYKAGPGRQIPNAILFVRK